MTDRLTGEDEFPLLRELTYLNTASVGLVPGERPSGRGTL